MSLEHIWWHQSSHGIQHIGVMFFFHVRIHKARTVRSMWVAELQFDIPDVVDLRTHPWSQKIQGQGSLSSLLCSGKSQCRTSIKDWSKFHCSTTTWAYESPKNKTSCSFHYNHFIVLLLSHLHSAYMMCMMLHDVHLKWLFC